ncbi:MULTISPECIES: response regulator transcription factor [Paenibacillus]|uniref:DNA-binding response regulator n=1 Tax=Paenibacillus odorifer TaxID=189426 RepID=A0A1R0WXV1_9BACL|nr:MULTISPECIES: response regulator transcription factor [Paenibacillus]ETT65601.1 two-component response regulator [Paenibacillus sp. FSL H8-237]MDH6428604.1 two-component system response regulator VanR [Paenibacillus sp. PastH-4]MDH6444803.1 two-component system response regulator VanR [Paenibacillus sp. PastF-4]MDH6528699.1 two-component system response regulator VanR [Paenibacillus sp. PastH-3]MEC0133125.1 response regulator transcription factor [Paenibacillus odorifer]
MKRETILLVDDEKEIVELLTIYLCNEGYRLLKAYDGMEALECLQKEEVDLIILDVMMPKMDGLAACMKIREERKMPIIILSAKNTDMDKISGLSLGADDYVGKPFNPLEIVARVKSQLRRYHGFNKDSNTLGNDSKLSFEDLTIDTSKHEVYVDQQKIKLTPREFSILELLARHQGQVLSLEQIYNKVWNEPFLDGGNTVMVHIRNLRDKIEIDSKRPRYIQTVWGVGYKLDGPS